MKYRSSYHSPLGKIILVAEGDFLTGLCFGEDSDTAGDELMGDTESGVIMAARLWLDEYFMGKNPSVALKLAPRGTEFQAEVWERLLQIPYGSTVSYSQLASELAEKRGIKRMSAQAVGGAVGRNPISLIIPCHRVVGKDGSLVGYAAGLSVKEALLLHEKSL